MLKLDRSKAVLAFLSLVIIASGCTGGGNEKGVTVTQTAGVTVQSFTATPSTVFEGQPATLELQLANAGGRNADNVQAKLFNAPINEGSGSWTGTSALKEVGSLRPGDPETDTPAITKPVTWSLDSPDLSQGVSIPYDFLSRIYYEYDTVGVTEIQVMDSERYRDSGATRQRPSVENSAGPVQLEVRTRTPLVFYGEEESNPSSELCVIAKNVGGGEVLSPDTLGINDVQNSENEVRLTVKASGSAISFAEGATTDTEIVPIVGTEGIHCFTVNAESSDIQQTVPITITADYGYYTESQTSVTVEGREDN